MSLHVEWLHTSDTTATALPAGSEIGDQLVGEGNVAIVFGYDEAVVIEGSKERLIKLLTTALRRVESVSHDDLVPADFEPEHDDDDDDPRWS